MQQNKLWDVVVIGGGPAGMMSAGRAAERGLRVLLLEKNSHLGKKLLISGGGRCNFTNHKLDIRVMLESYKSAAKFLFSPFSQFGVAETIDFFALYGMPSKTEAEGRMFPQSDSSQSVLDALCLYMQKGNVSIRTNTEVAEIKYLSAEKHIHISLKTAEVITAKKCIISTGGISHPETGSTGEGFKWLKNLGHTIAATDFSLVPIRLSDTWVAKVAGVTLQDIKLTSYRNNIKQKSYIGKLLFTHVGISGPTVLNMSRDVGDLLAIDEGTAYSTEKNNVTLLLDIFPKQDIHEIRKQLHDILAKQSNKAIKNALPLLIPPALSDVVLHECGINPDTPGHSVRTEQRKAIVALIKAWPLRVDGLLGKDKAIISSGGVILSEIDFKTMQSRIIPLVYVVGDMLNIDRPSGGYSLQLCWTTGYVAGNSC